MGIRDGTGGQPQKRNGKKSDVRDPMTGGDGTYGGWGNRLILFTAIHLFIFFFLLNGTITMNGRYSLRIGPKPSLGARCRRGEQKALPCRSKVHHTPVPITHILPCFLAPPLVSSAFTVPLVGQPAATISYLGKGPGRSWKNTRWILIFPMQVRIRPTCKPLPDAWVHLLPAV
ncbi:hypothetical protein BGX38DRAFT_752224 [Terfezia claveryi]|nr:hypothetical protein BGX38DRAFT_752224 [Terfezia claveryi]